MTTQNNTTDLVRTLGPWTVPALGMGTWALGGDWVFDGKPAGWGAVDDEVSIAAIRAAYEGGVRLIDTADVYGCGHSERVVGRAVAPFREDVVLTTKVGLVFDESTRTGAGYDLSPAYLRRACDASLRRLNTNVIDLYLVHPTPEPNQLPDIVGTFEEVVAAGKIRTYGTSAPVPESIAAIAAGEHGVAVQQELNVFTADPEALAACDRFDLGVLARSPLAMGLLSGKYSSPNDLAPSDVRRNTPWWTFFADEPGSSNAVSTSSSSVYVLRADTLTKVGELDGLGERQRIYAVRFIGALGYVVTFQQMDPLYTLDLRDPAAPRIAGTLELSGYSACRSHCSTSATRPIRGGSPTSSRPTSRPAPNRTRTLSSIGHRPGPR